MRRGLAVCAVALVLMAGCGTPPEAQRGQRTDPDPVPPLLARASAATQAAGAARVVSHGTMTLPGTTTAVKTRGFGVMAGRRVHFFGDMGESPTTGDLGMVEVIGVGTRMYMKSTFFKSLMPPDMKPWLKFNLDAIGDEMGLDLSALVQLSRDPMQTMDYLWGAQEVETVGHQRLYGVRTTHYRAVVDFRSAGDAAPPEIRDRIADTMNQLVALTGMETAPMDVWVDDAGLIRRMKYTMDFTAADPSHGVPPMKMTETMDFVKYGIDAKIAVPPASKVTDVLEFVEANGGDASF